MKLYVCGDLAGFSNGLLDPRKVAADCPHGIADVESLFVLFIQLTGLELPHNRSRAEQAAPVMDAFLVGPDHTLQRVTRLKLLFVQRAQDLDRGHRTDIAVEVSSFRHAVDVRAKQNDREIVLCARTPAVD